MRLWTWLSIAIATLSLAQVSTANHAGDCHEWEAEAGRLNQVIETLRGEADVSAKQAAEVAHKLATQEDLVRQYGEWSTTMQEQADSDKAGLAAALQQIQALQEQLKGEQEARASAEGRLRSVEEQLLSAEARAADGQRAALSADERALLKTVQDSWLPLWAQRRLSSSRRDMGVLYEELKTGNTSRYGLLAFQAYQAAQQQAATAQGFVSKKLDEHAPGVKAKFLQTVDSLRPHASTAWQHLDKHVLKAQWFRQVQHHLVKAELELRNFFTHHLRATPLLAPYADPVVIQVLVYSVFALPLLLVLGPVLLGLLTSRRSSQPEADAALKKKQSARKGARPPSSSSSSSNRATAKTK